MDWAVAVVPGTVLALAGGRPIRRGEVACEVVGGFSPALESCFLDVLFARDLALVDLQTTALEFFDKIDPAVLASRPERRERRRPRRRAAHPRTPGTRCRCHRQSATGRAVQPGNREYRSLVEAPDKKIAKTIITFLPWCTIPAIGQVGAGPCQDGGKNISDLLWSPAWMRARFGRPGPDSHLDHDGWSCNQGALVPVVGFHRRCPGLGRCALGPEPNEPEESARTVPGRPASR